MTDSDRLDKIESTLEKLVTDIDHLAKDVELLKQETSKTNDRVEIYQKASQQVVNLAFSLVLTATITIIVQSILH
jgi:hypothetical protein